MTVIFDVPALFAPMSTTMSASSSSGVASTSPASGGSSGLSLGGVLGVLISSAVIAAVVSAAVSVDLAWRRSREERARVRTVLAEAFEAVAAYKVFPYAIRRRGTKDAEGERIRLSEELRHVQAHLTYYSAWIRAESTSVGAAYDKLVTELRKVAGQACHAAWEADPIKADKDMNIGTDLVDLTSLTPLETAFGTASTDYLQDVLHAPQVLKGQAPPDGS